MAKKQKFLDELFHERSGISRPVPRSWASARKAPHTDDDGELIFRHACKMGLKGIVSKRRDLPYRSGRLKSWIMVNNPHGPAMQRAKDGSF